MKKKKNSSLGNKLHFLWYTDSEGMLPAVQRFPIETNTEALSLQVVIAK